MSNLRRFPVAARGAGDADRGQEYRRSLGDESLRRGAVLPRSGAYRLATAGRPDDARTGPRAARIPRGRRLALPDARPHPADLERRRTAEESPSPPPSDRAWSTCSTCSTNLRSDSTRATSTNCSRDHRPPRPRKHRGRGGARGGDHPRRRPGDRDRTWPANGAGGSSSRAPRKKWKSRPTASPATTCRAPAAWRSAAGGDCRTTAGFAWPERGATTCGISPSSFPLGCFAW